MKNRKKAESKPRADRMTPQQRRKRKWEMEQEDLAEYSKEFNLKKRLRKGETYSRIGLVRRYGNLQSYWTCKKIWKLTVVLDL